MNKLLTLCLASLWLSSSAVDAAETRPNILLIYVDDLAYNDIGGYSYPGDIADGEAPMPFPEVSAYAGPNQALGIVDGKWVSITPCLDRFAKQGIKLTCYHSPSSVCSPSRLGLLTGRTPARFMLGGIISKHNSAGLPSREITIPEMLKSVGYETAVFGKWHLGHGDQHAPTNHGFDHYQPATGDRATELLRLVQDASEFMSRDRDDPFFVYFACHQPHYPNVAHPDFVGSVDKLLGKRTYLKGDGTTDTIEISSAYHDVVHELDFRVEQLLRTLDQAGITDDTLVIFTSDNGPWSNHPKARDGIPGISGTGYPFRGSKFQDFEGSTRVPAIIRYPGVLAAGTVSNEPVTGLDWWKTFAGLAGASVPSDRSMDGYDVWPFLTGLPGATSPRPFVLHDRGKSITAISNRGDKQFTDRLVDVRTDFSEQRDVSDTRPELTAELKQQLDSINVTINEDRPGLENASDQRILVGHPGRYVEVPKGETSSFSIRLATAPKRPVVINFPQRSGSVGLTLNRQSVTFSTTNWHTPQDVTVTSAGQTTATQYATFEAVGTDQIPIHEIYIRETAN
ncbi:sulfatase-like hydrolase/transferase [Aporhodopirellula aestuarii]|uniref:Sulfatase-like hydrolase/transferase n=1 Tax=Aporhodopirellula aestuarii TaxID=2950107 RepID=A0ABT0UCI8_9BACT|nr:sulfatase-like hydrolase/transferase [Aporhodopirellula aestuarii]MCM2374749.1 sulfatase-like hydrolase/transferase [Aporhodopirellula aestuarii]